MDIQSEPTLIEFIRYDNWANQIVLHACQGLSEDQLATNTPGAYGTIRGTLEHIIRAEAGYVRLLTGNRPQPLLNWEAGPSLAEMTAYSIQVGNAPVDAAECVNRFGTTSLRN